MSFYLLPNLLSQLCTINSLYETLKISLIVITAAYVSYYYYKYFTRENPLPGPFPLPFIGNVHQVLKNLSYDVKDIHAKYGDLCEYYMGSQRFILVSDENLAQKILKPVIKGPFHNRFKDNSEGYKEVGLLNVGLSSTNYDDWSYHRRFFNKVMLASQFNKQSFKVVQDNFSEMSKHWDKLGEDKILEFNNWMKRYFLDTTFIIITNKPAYTIINYYYKINPDKESNIPKSILKESDMFVESASALTQNLLYFTSIPKVIRNFPGVNRYTQYLKDRTSWFRNHADNIIKLKREEISKTPIDQKLIPDMLTMFLTVNTERDVTERISDDLHDKPMSDKDVRINFMTTMTAGVDTSSNSMCFLVYCLESNPRVKQKMIEEIEHVLGKDPDSSFTFEDLSKLKYVEAVIKEASRKKTLATILARTNSASEVVGGHVWSKGTTFIINAVRIHNNKSYWKDPDTFNPDRFLEDPESKHHLYMFGGGLRKCPGRNLVMMELKTTLAMLYRKYNIELMGSLKEYTLTIRNCAELKVRLRKKNN